MNDRRARGKPTDYTPDLAREAPAPFKPIFGEYQRCTSCGGKMHAKGKTKLPCLTCIDTPGYVKIVPPRRADPPPG